MERVIIIRYSEIFLKGTNRGYFERVFCENIEKSLKGIQHELRHNFGRYFIENIKEEDLELIIDKLKRVFGIHTFSIAIKVDSSYENILSAAKEICPIFGSFKVETHRADKKFPLNSIQLNIQLGGDLLDENSSLSVDVHNPQALISVDIRENGKTFVFSEYIKGAGGMPVGTAGKGLLLLSGGIDSPVAGHMIAKRGMKVNCIHFHSYPYTNLQAKEKVIDLAKVLNLYTPDVKLYVVSVTKIQEEIHKRCNGEYMVTLLRRFMMTIAEKIALLNGEQCIITGESLGQVASQTIEGMTSSNSVVKQLPILRPVCGFDKNEIIERSKQMGAYEISILPYEDCCTVFLPRHPVIKPKMQDILAEQNKLDFDVLVENALSTLEIINI